ncbi:hypothetical protein RJ640_020358 [Escallonia rubra]|uniref:DUF4283 domain-containing protein n=1 Tax=Escallonia rubra TaxID=112253 RepID=A0AA88R2X0_9ASTE|nr:hypothetical protein RJ640_020358 [Escallonia rubra]
MEIEPGEADDPRSREHRTPLFSHADSSMRESDPVEAKNKVNPSSVKEIRKSYKDIVSANQGKEIEFDTLMEDSTSDEEEGEDSMDIPVHQCDEVDDNPLKPAISLSPNLLRKIRKKWENTLIVKLLGKSIGFRALSTRLRAMWNLQGEFEIIDLDGGFFLLKFDYIQDYHYVTNGGPWIILNHYLTVRKWEANFKPSEALETKTAVWLRLPELPIEYYDEKGPKALVVPGLVLTNAKTHPSPDLIPSRPIRSQDKPYNPTVEEDATNPNMITIPSHLPIAATPFISPSAFTPSICLEPKSPSSPPSQNFNPNSATSLTACLEPIRSVSPPTVANQLDLMETPCFQDNPDVPLDPDIPSFSTSVSMVAGTSRQPSPTQRYRSFSPDARRELMVERRWWVTQIVRTVMVSGSVASVVLGAVIGSGSCRQIWQRGGVAMGCAVHGGWVMAGVVGGSMNDIRVGLRRPKGMLLTISHVPRTSPLRSTVDFHVVTQPSVGTQTGQPRHQYADQEHEHRVGVWNATCSAHAPPGPPADLITHPLVRSHEFAAVEISKKKPKTNLSKKRGNKADRAQ